MILIIKHAENEGPGLIGQFFDEQNIEYKVIELGKREPIPSVREELNAVIVMGGPMNVYQEKEYPFLKAEGDFLKKCIKMNIPLMGICLGGQLIAKALGSRVEKAEAEEIGWQKISLTCKGILDPVFAGIDNVVDVFQWHGDKFNLPEGADLLAESDICPQAFRYKSGIYAFQFHFEVTATMLKSWFGPDKDRGFNFAENTAFKTQAFGIMSNFVSITGQGRPA
jgi:GMP synthase-like glutamine amidotransferase